LATAYAFSNDCLVRLAEAKKKKKELPHTQQELLARLSCLAACNHMYQFDLMLLSEL